MVLGKLSSVLGYKSCSDYLTLMLKCRAQSRISRSIGSLFEFTIFVVHALCRKHILNDRTSENDGRVDLHFNIWF